MNMNKIVRYGKVHREQDYHRGDAAGCAHHRADSAAGNFGKRPDKPGDDDCDQVERQEFALSVSGFHLAAEQPQSEHVQRDVPEVLGRMQKAVTE